MLTILAAALAVSVAPVDIMQTNEGGALAALETAAKLCDYRKPKHVDYLRHALAERFNVSLIEIDRIITKSQMQASIVMDKNPAMRADFCNGIKRIKLPEIDR